MGRYETLVLQNHNRDLRIQELQDELDKAIADHHADLDRCGEDKRRLEEKIRIQAQNIEYYIEQLTEREDEIKALNQTIYDLENN